ncbi:MAG: NAD(P)H-binding protein [Rhizomicrobium sp.]
MDGARSRGYGARSGYDVRTQCIRGCPAGRQGVKVLILGATGGTGRPIVRDAVANVHSVVGLVRSKARASELAGADLIDGDARDQSALHVLKFACARR